MPIIDNLFILPCLQEKRVQNESEQNGSIIESYDNIPNIIVPSSTYNKIWSGNDRDFLIKNRDKRVSILPLNDAMDNYKFKSKGSCKNVLTIDKWKMYGLFLLNSSNENDNNITSFFVTHHNRLRGLVNEKYKENSSYQIGRGLKDGYVGFKTLFGFSDSTLPLLPVIDESLCGAYANNFCLKIKYTPKKNLDINVAFPGYPDKGELSKECQKFSCDNKSCSLKQGGGEGYNYCCQELLSNINTNIIHEALIGYNDGTNFIPGVFDNVQKTITIYVVRHGNSLHNQPTNVSGNLRLDSSLTPLGIYQAYLLGNTLNKMYPEDFNKQNNEDFNKQNNEDFNKQNNEDFNKQNNIILCSSFLCRTQLTGLSILDAIFGYDKLPTKLKNDYMLLLRNSLYRFDNAGKREGIFFWKNESKMIKLDEPFSPLNREDKSYTEFIDYVNEIKSKISNDLKSKISNDQVSGKIKLKKIKKNTKNRREKKTCKKKKSKKTIKKTIKKTYQKGGECSDSSDFWSKLHLYL